MKMSKTQKELAFLRDLTIDDLWTDRFTTFADKHVKLPKKGAFLYVNAGSLHHTLALRDKAKKDLSFTCVCDDAHLRRIAEAKAAVTKSQITFKNLGELEPNTFDEILADLSFQEPAHLEKTLKEIVRVAKPGANIAFYLPSAGSFGEIYSFMWESFLEVGITDKTAEVERLIAQIPTVSRIEELAIGAGIIAPHAETATEIFEYNTSAELIESILFIDFLIPRWLEFLEPRKRNSVVKKLAKLIEAEHEGLTFRFTVKATLITGQNA